MKFSKVVALSLLLVSVTMNGAAATNDVSIFTAVLAYAPQSRLPLTSRVFRIRREAYRFRLIPESDVAGHLVVCELFLEGASHSWRPDNLLDPAGMTHGYQKWTFAASDFAHGPGKSIYGATRTIDLPKRGLTVQIDVVRAAVKPTPAMSQTPASYRFTDLTLRIRVRTASVGLRANSKRCKQLCEQRRRRIRA